MRKALYILTALAILYLIQFAVWLLSSSIASFFADVDPSTRAASVTAFASVMLFVTGKLWEQSKERRERLNADKIAIYRRFFEIYFNMFSPQQLDSEIDTVALASTLLDFQRDLIFWAPDNVIRAYMNFKDVLTDPLSSNIKTAPNQHRIIARNFEAVGALLVAMRRDIGYNFTSFTPRDLALLQLANDEETRKVFEHLKN